MVNLIKSYGPYLSVLMILTGLLVIFIPGIENTFILLLGTLSILLGAATLISVIKSFNEASHPLFTILLALILIGLGIYVIFFSSDIRFGFLTVAIMFIAIALERFNVYESRKGTKSAIMPFIYSIIYWIFAVLLAKGAGSENVENNIFMTGILFIITGIMTLLSIYWFHDFHKSAAAEPLH